MPTVVFAGGGTGGHIFPGLAVIEELITRFPGIHPIFIGTSRLIERQIAADNQLSHYPVSTSCTSQLFHSPIQFLSTNVRAYRSALTFLVQHQPSVVIGLGGFPSIPVVLAARKLKVPIILLEQNIVLGRANRFLLPFASYLCSSYSDMPAPRRYAHRIIVTGNPVRRTLCDSNSFQSPDRSQCRQLLILGGSQGASLLNQAVTSSLPQLQSALSGWEIVHQTGVQDFAWVSQVYMKLGIQATVLPFITQMDRVYRSTGLVVSRSGATTLAELAIQGLPAILVPHPTSIRNHQLLNARHHVRMGAAILVEQRHSVHETSAHLTKHLTGLLTDFDLRSSMASKMSTLAHPQAAEFIATLVANFIYQEPKAISSRWLRNIQDPVCGLGRSCNDS